MPHAEMKPIISYDSAKELVDKALKHADQNGWSVCAVVVDPSGNLVAAGRMNGVPAPVFEYANDKAYTATLGKSSRAFFERMNSSPELHMGMVNRPRVCAWDGGLPIIEEGQVIGGLGVSGAAGPDDVACGEAALTGLGLTG
ncbi:MAG: heme-binding protein [Pseudomonadota bacterium]